MVTTAIDEKLKGRPKVSYSELSKSRAAMEAALQQSMPPAKAAADVDLSSEMLPCALASD